MSETRVAVAELKARLSEYLRQARSGETVVVTDRGTPVARLGPLVGGPAVDARVDELAAAGLVRPAGRPLDPALLEERRPADPAGRSLAGILEERAEGP